MAVRVVATRSGPALVLTLSGAADGRTPADMVRTLSQVTSGTVAASPVVVDLREVGVLTADLARTLSRFARGCAGRGVRCAFVTPAAGAAVVALDVADPEIAGLRFATLEQALRGGAGPYDEDVPGGVLPGAERVVDVTDADAARQLLVDSYADMRIDGGERQRGMRLASTAVGPVRLDRVDFRMEFHADIAPLEQYAFAQLVAGDVSAHVEGADRHYHAGDVFLAARPDRPHTAFVGDSVFAVAMIDIATVDRVAQTGPHHPGSIRFTEYDALAPGSARAWNAVYAQLHDNVLASPRTMAHPLVVGNAARLLAATALATFPNTAVTEPTAEDRHDGHPHTLRRAVAFIEANADRDISVTDIAGAAHVSVRAVQLTFRRHLDTTPMAYLRRVRLDSARADLRAALPGQDTITRIAARWGYGRPSVFAARYRTAYGETPSQTLRDGED